MTSMIGRFAHDLGGSESGPEADLSRRMTGVRYPLKNGHS
jgi:hypothetical protein